MVEKKVKPQRSEARQTVFRIADRAFDLLEHSIRAGYANAPEGIIAEWVMTDLLHGGAYARPINELPYFRTDPSSSRWSPGDISNITNFQTAPGWLGDLSGLFIGGGSTLNGGEILKEVMLDSNVPHVLPKLVSDQTYGAVMLVVAATVGTDIFKTQAGGLKTLMEGTIKPASEIVGGALTSPLTATVAGKAGSAIKGAFARADTAAQEIGGASG